MQFSLGIVILDFPKRGDQMDCVPEKTQIDHHDFTGAPGSFVKIIDFAVLHGICGHDKKLQTIQAQAFKLALMDLILMVR